MPAKDRYHELVKRAFVKAGWTIAREQVYMSDNHRHIWIDLGIRRENDETLILIEIKGFDPSASMLDALMSAIGQYVVYRAMLDFLELQQPLYLAIPTTTYDGIFQIPVAKQAIVDLGIRLVVFNPLTEEIVQWKG